jgi:hypothetical protein
MRQGNTYAPDNVEHREAPVDLNADEAQPPAIAAMDVDKENFNAHAAASSAEDAAPTVTADTRMTHDTPLARSTSRAPAPRSRSRDTPAAPVCQLTSFLMCPRVAELFPLCTGVLVVASEQSVAVSQHSSEHSTLVHAVC